MTLGLGTFRLGNARACMAAAIAGMLGVAIRTARLARRFGIGRWTIGPSVVTLVGLRPPVAASCWFAIIAAGLALRFVHLVALIGFAFGMAWRARLALAMRACFAVRAGLARLAWL